MQRWNHSIPREGETLGRHASRKAGKTCKTVGLHHVLLGVRERPGGRAVGRGGWVQGAWGGGDEGVVGSRPTGGVGCHGRGRAGAAAEHRTRGGVHGRRGRGVCPGSFGVAEEVRVRIRQARLLAGARSLDGRRVGVREPGDGRMFVATVVVVRVCAQREVRRGVRWRLWAERGQGAGRRERTLVGVLRGDGVRRRRVRFQGACGGVCAGCSGSRGRPGRVGRCVAVGLVAVVDIVSRLR